MKNWIKDWIDRSNKKLDDKKKWTKKKWTRKKKWTKKLDEPKTKIGRNFQPQTLDFDPAPNTARGEIIFAGKGALPERRQTPQIERGGDAQIKWIRIPAASLRCLAARLVSGKRGSRCRPLGIDRRGDTSIYIIHVQTIHVSCVGRRSADPWRPKADTKAWTASTSF